MTDTQHALEAVQISLDSRDDGSQDVYEARRSSESPRGAATQPPQR